ncbi:PLP-dependent aminotransferase family protein [uncultured Vibrio sp.]|uniref:aminotransferase-like domain-containing protein n=1 Tax=uncultured Vibrio sp. TaxID=114054 RepID=UPI000910D6C8|nr:PLP-dependent aminotransferase family protein [uncultured Vibrio sp.]OIQ26560.1 MAG: GntR family transcriptional regulator [Vibrio sp. MedPE-SWchi]
MAKYVELAEQIKDQIRENVWEIGGKLPSLRKQTELSGLSLMTVMNAYHLLESQGWVVSHSRSGYVVAPQIRQQAIDSVPRTLQATESVDINDFVFDILQASRKPSITNFGFAYPAPNLYPHNRVNRSLVQAAREMPTSNALDNLPPGNETLRKIIAKRYAAQGMNINPDEIVITAGALEALNLSLQSVTKAGDWVVVESPAFYGALQALERLNLRALFVNTHPKEGIDLDSLERALQTHPVKACWLMTNFQNPLGFTLSDEKKQRLIALLTEHNVHLIEDDVYSELYFGNTKPLPAKAFDQNGMTLHCSSFSKSLVAGFRIGWVAAGKKALQIQKIQLMSTLSTSAPVQLTLANYLSTRHYETHLRQLRRQLEQRKYQTWQLLQEHLPKEANAIYSAGGYFIWVVLPVHINTTELYRMALKENISIAPGEMFDTNQQFNHCFRLNASLEITPGVALAIQRLCELVKALS